MQLSTLQAAALLAFSGSGIATLSYEQLSSMLQLPEEALKRVLHSLSCGQYKILKKDPATSSIKTGDTFTANDKFT